MSSLQHLVAAQGLLSLAGTASAEGCYSAAAGVRGWVQVHPGTLATDHSDKLAERVSVICLWARYLQLLL
jgi:hypothetical protein